MKDPFLGCSTTQLDPYQLTLAECAPNPNMVYIIGRNLENGKHDYFHGTRHNGEQHIVMTPLITHARGFNDIRMLAIWAKFLKQHMITSEFTVLERHASHAELAEPKPTWRVVAQSNNPEEVSAFAAAVKKMLAAR